MYVLRDKGGMGGRKITEKRDTKDIPKPILEPPRRILQVPHPAGTGGLSELGPLAPLIRPKLGRGEATGCVSVCGERAAL